MVKPDLRNEGYRNALKDIATILRLHREPVEAVAEVEVFITRYLDKVVADVDR